MKPAKRRILCVYCGKRERESMDHVIPASLFPDARPEIMVTVPACLACNQEKKADDDYLRDWLVLDIENTGHPVAEGSLRDKMLRASNRGQSLLAKDVRRKSRLLPVHTPAGLYIGHSPAVPLDYQRANRLFARIVRGLYYQLYKRRLPDETEFNVRRINPNYKRSVAQGLIDIGVKEVRKIGKDFECMNAIGAEDSTVTSWLMRFFNIYISVTTNLGMQEEPLPPSPQPSILTSWLSPPN